MQPIKRPSIRKSKSQHPIEIQPDYTEDESEEQNNNNHSNNNPVAFSSYYPSGSMTLPHPKHKKSSQSQTSATSELKKDQAEDQTNPASSAGSAEPKKSLNESGESDPGYESDSSKSKSNSSGGQPQPSQPQSASVGLEASTALLMTEPKATTLPRRSATVQKNSALQHTLDRRKLRAEPALATMGTRTESEAGLTVEIISPVRVSLNTISFFLPSDTLGCNASFY